MNLECLNDIITKNLAIHIDISDSDSWNLNTGLTSISLTQWDGAKSDNINLYDFGLTMFDNGRTDKMYSGNTFTPDDTKVTLYRVGYNDATGGTFYDLYPLTSVTSGSSVGNYFDTNGGYLQGFFKMDGYNFEQFPSRYNEGITIETLIRIDSLHDGIFYLMGARAEDKYNTYFSGETELEISTTTTNIRTGIIGQSSTIINTTSGFSGVYTSELNNLHAILDTDVRKNAFQLPESDQYNTIPLEQPKDSINENVIAFMLQSDGSLAIKRIDENGVVYKRQSTNKIISTGWTHITIVFKPDEVIEDEDLLECLEARLGTLRIFVNGRLFWKVPNYNEFFFKNIKNQKEKQIGVPYNISWGGGSFGLKHSWHYDYQTYDVYTGQSLSYITSNFELIENPLKIDPCDEIIDIADANIGGIYFTANTTSFTEMDDCDNIIPITAMTVVYSGGSGLTTGNQYFIAYTGSTAISNREYIISMDIYDTGIFSGTSQTISLIAYGNNTFTTISEITYDGRNVGDWSTINLITKLPDNVGLQDMNIGILIESNYPLQNNFIMYIKNFTYVAADVLSQDTTKDDLLIEQNFNTAFIGGIQKLRIYDIPFDNQMVLHNAKIESNKQSYGFTVSGGGRLIYNSF